MITLKNEYLEVLLANKGAEIHKIVGQHDGINYMWKRDARQWANSAPILFPIVGNLRNNECRIHGKTYTMTQHGFSRHHEYQENQVSDTKVVFTLQTNEEIKKQYPFLFDLKVTYTLEKNTLICDMQVTNIDQQEIYFQIGGHPAFACPFMENESSNDYYLELEKNETLTQKIIDIEKGGMSHHTKLFFDNEKRFFVRQELFNNNAIVLKDVQSKYIALKSLNHDKSIVFHMEGFNYLGIWTANHVGDLLAIEPWVGHADYVDFDGEFNEKQGVVTLQPGEEFGCTFKVEINQ